MSMQKSGKSNADSTSSIKTSGSKEEKWAHDRYDQLQQEDNNYYKKPYNKNPKHSSTDQPFRQVERKGNKEKNGSQNSFEISERSTHNNSYFDQGEKTRNGDLRKQQNSSSSSTNTDKDQISRSQKNKRKDQEYYRPRGSGNHTPSNFQYQNKNEKDGLNPKRDSNTYRESNNKFSHVLQGSEPSAPITLDKSSASGYRDSAPAKKTRENSSSTNGTNKLIESSHCPSDPRIISNNESTTENLSNDDRELPYVDKSDVNEDLEESSGNIFGQCYQRDLQMLLIENKENVQILIDGTIETKNGPHELQIHNLDEFEKQIDAVCQQNQIDEVVSICIKLSFLRKFSEENKDRNINKEVIDKVLNYYTELFKKREAETDFHSNEEERNEECEIPGSPSGAALVRPELVVSGDKLL